MGYKSDSFPFFIVRIPQTDIDILLLYFYSASSRNILKRAGATLRVTDILHKV